MKKVITSNLDEYERTYNKIRSEPDIVFDHKAFAAGYLSRNNVYIEQYEGTHGEGYVVHLPTVKSNITSGAKNIHLIEYWIVKFKKEN